jgi:hypothetical protein
VPLTNAGVAMTPTLPFSTFYAARKGPRFQRTGCKINSRQLKTPLANTLQNADEKF